MIGLLELSDWENVLKGVRKPDFTKWNVLRDLKPLESAGKVQAEGEYRDAQLVAGVTKCMPRKSAAIRMIFGALSVTTVASEAIVAYVPQSLSTEQGQEDPSVVERVTYCFVIGVLVGMFIVVAMLAFARCCFAWRARGKRDQAVQTNVIHLPVPQLSVKAWFTSFGECWHMDRRCAAIRDREAWARRPCRICVGAEPSIQDDYQTGSLRRR